MSEKIISNCHHKVLVIDNEEYMIFLGDKIKKYKCMNCGMYFIIEKYILKNRNKQNKTD
jgi:hypothetical protein